MISPGVYGFVITGGETASLGKVTVTGNTSRRGDTEATLPNSTEPLQVIITNSNGFDLVEFMGEIAPGPRKFTAIQGADGMVRMVGVNSPATGSMFRI